MAQESAFSSGQTCGTLGAVNGADARTSPESLCTGPTFIPKWAAIHVTSPSEGQKTWSEERRGEERENACVRELVLVCVFISCPMWVQSKKTRATGFGAGRYWKWRTTGEQGNKQSAP